MSDTSPSLEDAISSMIDNRLRQISTFIPGRIVSYDARQAKATVQPLIKQVVENEEGDDIAETLPQVPDVPVVFFGNTSNFISCPVKSGDIVLLVASQASMDIWVNSGGLVDPQDDRHHDLSDCVAILGLRPFNDPFDGTNSDAMVIHANEIKLGSKNANDRVLRASDMLELANIFTSAAVTATDGGATLKTNVAAAINTTSWGSGKVKAE